MNGLNPLAERTDVIERVVSGRTKRRDLDTLLQWNWAAEKAAEAVSTG